MSNWIPTNKLRFVMREEFHGITKALQQKWEKKVLNEDTFCHYTECEWRDVPVVEED